MTDIYSYSALKPEDYHNLMVALAANGDATPDVVRRTLLLSSEFGALGTIDELGLLIHQGRMFIHSDIHTGLGAGASHYHIIDTSSVQPTGHGHMRMAKLSAEGGPFWIELYKNTQVSSLGAAAPMYNLHQGSSRTAMTQLFQGAVVTSDGTLLVGDIVPGTQQSGDITDNGALEWILTAGTRYALKVTNKSAQAQNWALTLLGHE